MEIKKTTCEKNKKEIANNSFLFFTKGRRGLTNWLKQIESNWQKIDKFEIPQDKLKHIAVICDGNRRAARKQNLHPYFGHRAGVTVIKGISKACQKWGLRVLTFWVWSTENWQREEKQVKYIMNLAAKFLQDSQLKKEFLENKVRFVHLGRKDRLPPKIKKALIDLEKETEKFDQYQFNLAMDYGGIDEAGRAIVKIIQSFKKGLLKPTDITQNPSLIFNFLDTAGQFPPDLVIRTGVDKTELPHTSGFMPLQTAYSCWQFIPDLFPDLTPAKLLQTIKEFLDYERRLGR